MTALTKLAARVARKLRRTARDGRAEIEQWLGCRNLHPRAVVDPRFPGQPLIEKRTPIGTYFLPASTYRGWVESVLRRGEVFEPEIVAMAKEYARPGTTVIDSGANLGQMTLLFADMVGPQGKVVALEANAYVFAALERTIRANGATNVDAYHRAVFDRSGKSMFLDAKDWETFSTYGAFGLNPSATSGETVESLAIDDLQIEEPVSFMKIDVQGSDLFALKGARETIMRHRMPIVFEYEEQFQARFGTTFQDYMEFVAEIGYRVAKTAMGINYLIVPRERPAAARPEGTGE